MAKIQFGDVTEAVVTRDEFPIEKAREGFYAYTKFKAPAPAIEKLNRHFRVLDTVLRVTTFRAHVTKEAPKKKAAAPAPAPAAQ